MRKFNLRNESGQTALEAAIILIAFIVVASVFAFTILAAGTSSTEKGEEAIYAGLEGVQSSMTIKGAVMAESNVDETAVEKVIFTLASVSGSDPIDLTAPATNDGGTAEWLETRNNHVVIAYRDGRQVMNEVAWTVEFIGANDGDQLLEDGELAEITVYLTGVTGTEPPNLESGLELAANMGFTVEVKPPTGAVMALSRTTPSVVEKVMELR